LSQGNYNPRSETREFYKNFPKVELHRHLEGSVTPEILLDIAGKYGVSLPTHDLGELREAIHINGNSCSLKEFLDRFFLLGLAFPTLEAVEEVAWRVCRQCWQEGIRLVELRFSPVFMTLEQYHSWPELLEAIIAGVSRARADFDLEVGLIIGVSRSNSIDKAREVIELAGQYSGKGLVGLDLFGDEAPYPPEIFAEVFLEARRNNLNITIHAGEGGGETNIRTAVEKLGASRIGHGVRVINDPELLIWLKERDISLEICVTSNVHTCTVAGLEEHPVREIYDSGLIISINTDDPAISDITLIDEYSLVAEVFHFTPSEMKSLVLGTIRQSFLPREIKARVREDVEKEFSKIPDQV